MEKEVIPYEQAIALKELGFDERWFFTYEKKQLSFMSGTYQNHMNWKDIISAPLYQQAFRFFREKYNLKHEVDCSGNDGYYHAFVNDFVYGNNGISPSLFTYEEAELACIKKLIEIVKSSQPSTTTPSDDVAAGHGAC